jgi:hypothetical protein
VVNLTELGLPSEVAESVRIGPPHIRRPPRIHQPTA